MRAFLRGGGKPGAAPGLFFDLDGYRGAGTPAGARGGCSAACVRVKGAVLRCDHGPLTPARRRAFSTTFPTLRCIAGLRAALLGSAVQAFRTPASLYCSGAGGRQGICLVESLFPLEKP